MIGWVGWTTPRRGLAGADDPGMLQHSAVDAPIPPDDRGCTGVWVGSRKSSRDAVPRSPLKQSGIGPAGLGGRPAPLSRAWLPEAVRRLFSLRRERTVPPLAPRAEGVQAGRERAAQPHATHSCAAKRDGSGQWEVRTRSARLVAARGPHPVSAQLDVLSTGIASILSRSVDLLGGLSRLALGASRSEPAVRLKWEAIAGPARRLGRPSPLWRAGGATRTAVRRPRAVLMVGLITE